MIDSDKISIKTSNDCEFEIKSKVSFMEGGTTRFYFIDINNKCYMIRPTPLNVYTWNTVVKGDIIHFVEYNGKFNVGGNNDDKYLTDVKIKV